MKSLIIYREVSSTPLVTTIKTCQRINRSLNSIVGIQKRRPLYRRNRSLKSPSMDDDDDDDDDDNHRNERTFNLLQEFLIPLLFFPESRWDKVISPPCWRSARNFFRGASNPNLAIRLAPARLLILPPVQPTHVPFFALVAAGAELESLAAAGSTHTHRPPSFLSLLSRSSFNLLNLSFSLSSNVGWIKFQWAGCEQVDCLRASSFHSFFLRGVLVGAANFLVQFGRECAELM